jgi:DNA mismatch repair protein MutS
VRRLIVPRAIVALNNHEIIMTKDKTRFADQYRSAKLFHPNMLLLVRMGDFYEFFEQDAEPAAKTLGLTLTAARGFRAMAGFPHHQLNSYLHRLLQAGHELAVCDQVDEQGLPNRKVVRVVVDAKIRSQDQEDA